MTHFLRRRAARAGLYGAVVAAVLGAGACSTLNGVQSPRSAREAAATQSAHYADRSPQSVDCAVKKCIALTFDGGPSAPTPKLLDVLKKENVHVTFFVQGKGHTDTYPRTLRRMAAEGHEIGNHTWSHKVLTEQDEKGIRDEISPVQRDVRRITGRTPILMRPPQGRTDDDVSAVMKKLGLAQILWSATAKDYSTTDTGLITRRILDQSHRDGIILLHDRYKGTIPAVPKIIEALRRRGFTIVTVSQLLAPAAPEPGAVYRP